MIRCDIIYSRVDCGWYVEAFDATETIVIWRSKAYPTRSAASIAATVFELRVKREQLVI